MFVYRLNFYISRNSFKIVAKGTATSKRQSYKSDNWYLGEDGLVDGGTEINITQRYREYDRQTYIRSSDGTIGRSFAILVSYNYNKTYDPMYAKLSTA